MNRVSLGGIAVLIALAGTFAAFLLLGRPPLSGIDDANVTQTYARNLAAGHGYVFTPGHEWVEGSTSLFWTLIVTGVFLLPTPPDATLLTISLLLTAGWAFLILDIAILTARHLAVSSVSAVALYSTYLLGQISFFAWSGLSLMDTGLWCLLWAALLRVALGELGAERPGGRGFGLPLLGALLVATRPEAAVLVPAVLALGWIVAGRATRSRRWAPAIGASILVALALTLARWAYFGVPWPNTYYAVVSSHGTDNFDDGVRYFRAFLTREPFGGVLILATLASLVLHGRRLLPRAPESDAKIPARITTMVSGFILLVLALYLAIGGDHFWGFRLYLPIAGLLFLPLLAVGADPAITAARPRVARGILLLLVLLAGSLVVVRAHHFRTRNQLRQEFVLAQEGRRLGKALNEIPFAGPPPTVAVVAAGGVSRTFDGRVVDLMGLNWTEMARPHGRREGIRGHSAFNPAVFWHAPPDLVTPHLVAPGRRGLLVLPYEERALRGIQRSKRFRLEYVGVSIPLEDEQLQAFARRDWVERQGSTIRLRVVVWGPR